MEDEVTNDTRMLSSNVNPVQQTAPSMASTLALPSIQPQNWASLKNSTGIPLDFMNTNIADSEDEDEDEDDDTLSKNRKNRNRKNRGKKSNKKNKNKKIKFGTLPVVVSPGEF